jgi:RecA/RadA recombinase
MAITEQELMTLRIKLENGIKLTKDEKKTLKDNDKEAQEKKKGMSFGQRMASAAKSEYAQLMGDNEVDNFPIRDWISTGNYLLNAQISADPFKGMPSGRIWQLAGLNSCGKTFLMLETVKNAQKDHGYFFVLYDTEMANNDKESLKKRGIDTENMLFVPVATVEDLMTSVVNLLDEIGKDDKVIIGIDSIGNISTNKEINDTTEGNDTKDMTRAAKLKAFFRTCTIKAGIKNVPMIPINHVYAQIGGFGGKVIGGGEGPAYNASITNEFTKAQIKNSKGDETIGGCITSTVTKCRTAKEKTKVKFDIDFEEGLTLYSGLLEFCIDEKLLAKSANSFVFAPALKGERFYDEIPRSKAKLDAAFWEGFLQAYLADFMRAKFSYQSLVSELMTPEEMEEAAKE